MLESGYPPDHWNDLFTNTSRKSNPSFRTDFQNRDLEK